VKRLEIITAIWIATSAYGHGQTLGSSVALAGHLQKAADQAQVLATQLPSFSCTESGVSELLRDGRLKKQLPFTATIRALRSASGQINEVQTILTVNGKPVGKHPELPFNVHEAFTDVLSYVDARAQSCFVYKLRPPSGDNTRIDFESTGNYVPACANLPGTTGFFLADTAGKVTHMERTVPADLSDEGDIVPFAAVDLAPVELGGKTYMLASHLVSEREDGKEMRRLDATFTDCKLFKAEITIRPGGLVNERPPE
jgi:hypothetical protein